MLSGNIAYMLQGLGILKLQVSEDEGIKQQQG
jgi:hypothetical protein